MKVQVKGKVIHIEIDLETPHPSSSGKTTVRASSHGNQKTECIIDGKPLYIGLNAYTKNNGSE